ncbi:MBL fold metallo-hydrolase [Streptomyces tricolor]|nr:MBL fold metallo-hydrolase [Streptomyces tricolor]
METHPVLHPGPGPRQTPIAGVVLTDAELDHTLGIWRLREADGLEILATAPVRQAVDGRLGLGAVLTPYTTLTWRDLEHRRTQPLGADASGPAGSGVRISAVPPLRQAATLRRRRTRGRRVGRRAAPVPTRSPAGPPCTPRPSPPGRTRCTEPPPRPTASSSTGPSGTRRSPAAPASPPHRDGHGPSAHRRTGRHRTHPRHPVRPLPVHPPQQHESPRRPRRAAAQAAPPGWASRWPTTEW